MSPHDSSTSPDLQSAEPTRSQPLRAARNRWGFAVWLLRQFIAPGLFLLAGGVVIVSVGIAQRSGWLKPATSASAASAGTSDAIHTCPMHPQIRQPGPGRCPICGMELVAAAGGNADLDELAVRIEPAQRRLAGIETASAERIPMFAEIESVGSIAIDESRMATISSWISGRVERLFADYTGVNVARGDHLAVIYSPQLFAAQVEYLEARRSLTTMTSDALAIVRVTQEKLVASARQRLVELGMTSEQLMTLEQSGEAESRLTIYAPQGGTVIEKLMAEGDYVEAGQPVYRIANLDTVWLMMELFPEDASRIRFGQRVTAEVQSLPGETFEGRVAFVDPTVDVRKRTVGVRVEFLNQTRRLRPGDFASARIAFPIGPQGEVYDAGLAGKWISPMHPQIIRDEPGPCPICGMDLVPTTRYGYAENPVEQPLSLVVPRSSVLLAGDRSVIYVEEEPGRFEIRVVTLGPVLRDQVIIVDGLKAGEQVATAGNFLIDSQMQLAGKPSLIDPTRAIAAQRERNTPLELTPAELLTVSGTSGQQLEQLYEAYFRIQKSLADDKPPAEADARLLHSLALQLSQVADLPPESGSLLEAIARDSEHLHHLSLDKARHDAFRPVSHALIALAAQLRGDSSPQPFYHMFCPMVKGGAGDWLQATDQLRNPYYGSAMLKCGDVVQPLGAGGGEAVPAEELPAQDTPKREEP